MCRALSILEVIAGGTKAEVMGRDYPVPDLDDDFIVIGLPAGDGDPRVLPNGHYELFSPFPGRSRRDEKLRSAEQEWSAGEKPV